MNKLQLDHFASRVLMVEPSRFAYNKETSDNVFSRPEEITPSEQALCHKQFQALKQSLRLHGIKVESFKNDNPDAVDALFPNNWFSTHQIGKKNFCIYYPMKAPNRRIERLPIIKAFLESEYNLLADVSAMEIQSPAHFLEGTGVLVFDHPHRRVFMAHSERSSVALAEQICEQLVYKLHSFHTHLSTPIYHTNVMLAFAHPTVVVCLEVIENPTERQGLKQELEKDYELLPISTEQMHHYCGNILALKNTAGEKCLVMSTQAFQHFNPHQKKWFEKHFTHLIHCDLSTIEKYGGGSARCMLGELF